MYIYGAGGHAKVILEILEANDLPIDGIFDDNLEVMQLWEYNVEVYPYKFPTGRKEFIIAIGNNMVRKQIANRLAVRYGRALHPHANLSPRAGIGRGTTIMAGATVNADVIIGEHCIVNTNASVGHECALGDFVHISPRATLCGNVTVGEGTQVGAGAVVIPGIVIGEWAMIGAGTVVIRDVPDGVTVVGNPGKIIHNYMTHNNQWENNS